MNSENFIHETEAAVESFDRSCSASSGRKIRIDYETMKKNSGLTKYLKLIHIGIFFSFHLLLFILLTSCNETFQPLSDSSTSPVSMYGYLDASADTQWVRVTPVRELVDMPPVKPEMEVIPKHKETGNSVLMKDSLITLQDGMNIVNVWTTREIEPGQTYTLEGQRPDGASSRAVVTIPAENPSVELVESEDGCTATLRTEGVESLADIQSRWHIRFLYLTQGVVTFEMERFYLMPYRSKAVRLAAGHYSVFLDSHDEMNRILDQFLTPPSVVQVLRRDIFVASGGPEWVEELVSIDDFEYVLPEGFSNVENGLGYMVGIASTTIPWESCYR